MEHLSRQVPVPFDFLSLWFLIVGIFQMIAAVAAVRIRFLTPLVISIATHVGDVCICPLFAVNLRRLVKMTLACVSHARRHQGKGKFRAWTNGKLLGDVDQRQAQGGCAGAGINRFLQILPWSVTSVLECVDKFIGCFNICFY